MSLCKRSLLVVAVALALTCSAGAANAQIPLGVVFNDSPKGIEVKEVYPGGIADRFMPRLRPGARVITVNGLPVKSAENFAEVLQNSTYIRFEFVDLTGELRWAYARSGGTSAVPTIILAPPVPTCPVPCGSWRLWGFRYR